MQYFVVSLAVSDLLRKAYLAASRSGIAEFITWIESEQNGYTDAARIPDYRRVTGEVKALNPVRGWIPIQFSDLKDQHFATTSYVGQPTSEIEALVQNGNLSSQVFITLNSRVEAEMRRQMGRDFDIKLHSSLAQLSRILKNIRNEILKRAILAEQTAKTNHNAGPNLSTQDRATTNVVNVNNFYGDVVQSQIEQDVRDSTQALTTPKK